MAALVLHITDAGLAAVQGASGSDQAVVTQLGLTGAAFDPAPTITALPGEFKRIAVEAGIAAAPNVTHLTAYDTSADVWSARGLALYLADGTLFAVYASADVVLSKAARAHALIAADITFGANLAANITFGNVDFIWPPATEETRGIARVARQQRVDAEQDGEDDAWTFVTPRTLRARFAAFRTSVNGSLTAISTGMQALSTSVGTSLTALTGRRVTGGGLVSGGGDLSADRMLTVTEATAEDVAAGTAADKVITPRRLGPMTMLLQENGFIRFLGFQLAWGRFTSTANGTTPVVFAQPFPTACFSAVVSGVVGSGVDSQDNHAAVIVSTITKAGFSVFSADDTANTTCFIAVGY